MPPVIIIKSKVYSQCSNRKLQKGNSFRALLLVDHWLERRWAILVNQDQLLSCLVQSQLLQEGTRSCCCHLLQFGLLHAYCLQDS